MASRRATMSTSSFKNTSTDSKSSKGGNVKANNTGAGKKSSVKSSSTIVKSRYLQSLEKTSLSKSNSLTNESVTVPPRPISPKPSHVKPRVATPPRRSIVPQALPTPMMSTLLEPSLFGKSILQSTFSDGHCIAPDFDISVIKDKTVIQNTVEPERNPENEKRNIEMQTFLLAYLTAKMESNTEKLKAEAEARLREEMEEEQRLHNEVQEKKRQWLLMEKDKQMNELLDLQIAALTPMAEAAKQFTKEYKSFATAIDTTRHELPIKNFYIEGDRREFLDKAESCLKESEKVLEECTQGDQQENSASVECLRDMKMASKDISQQLSGTFSELLELSSLECRHMIHIQQAFEEEELGTTRIQELYCPKHVDMSLIPCNTSLDVAGKYRYILSKQPMSNRRTPRRNTHSQRRGPPAGRAWRQSQEQWRGQGHQSQGREGEGKESPRRQEQETVPRGICQSMCPARELQERETQNRLHRFEMLAGTERDRRPRADPLRAVKEYSRPAAGKDSTRPSDLRPPAVLLKTVCYLIDDIAASPSLQPWIEAYDFVFDRLRSVRQDMIIQRVSGLDCMAVLERTVRFLVYASYHLCGEPLRLYDPRINDTHLQESLSWLLDCYATGKGPYPNQEEFQSLSLLYNLGSARVMQHTMELPERLRTSPAVSLALSINRAFLERNPVRLLRLAQKLNFLQGCALHRHLGLCRRDLLLIYSHGFSSRNCRMPLHRLSQLLTLDRPLTAQLCQAHGVEVNPDNQAVFSKTSFTDPEPGKLHCTLYHGIVAEKQRELTIGSIIHGCS
ncbi:uncharacterized protein ACJ7VT_001633 [Polymixia lowei]